MVGSHNDTCGPSSGVLKILKRCVRGDSIRNHVLLIGCSRAGAYHAVCVPDFVVRGRFIVRDTEPPVGTDYGVPFEVVCTVVREWDFLEDVLSVDKGWLLPCVVFERGACGLNHKFALVVGVS